MMTRSMLAAGTALSLATLATLAAAQEAKPPAKGAKPPAAEGEMQRLERPGARAISAPVSVAAPVAAMLKPGAKVDLSVTATVNGKRQASVFMTDVEVVGADKEAMQAPGPAGRERRMVTFLADREGALKISLAANAGEITALVRAAEPAKAAAPPPKAEKPKPKQADKGKAEAPKRPPAAPASGGTLRVKLLLELEWGFTPASGADPAKPAKGRDD